MSDTQRLLEKLLTQGAIFKPANAVQSARVQAVLMAMGFVWRDGDTKICEHDACTSRGLYANAGQLSLIKESDIARVRYDSCKTLLALDIEDVMGVSTLPLMQAFKLVNDRQRVIEGKLDRVLAVIEPQVIGKPTLLRKDGGAKP